MKKYLSIIFLFLLPALAFAGSSGSEVTPAPQLVLSNEYMLDEVSGEKLALYSGAFMRSYVDPKYHVSSLEELEQRVSLMPPGSKIHWTPTRLGASGEPLLFAHDGNSDEFRHFCQMHKIDLEIKLRACDKKEDCGNYCIDAGRDRECKALPSCENRQCKCMLECL